MTSLPSRTTAALPSGTVSSVGCGPFTEYRRLCSRKMTGLSSRIADLSRPFASAGFEGATILMPGMPWNQVPWICECIAPKRPPAPTAERTTSGTLACSFDTYQNFADWFTRLSIGSAMKSPNMISITGRSPVTAAPNAAPAIASSEIGVSKTRSGPCFSCSPGVVMNTPPGAATSSPKKTTAGSRSISSSSASRIAVRNSSSLIP